MTLFVVIILLPVMLLALILFDGKHSKAWAFVVGYIMLFYTALLLLGRWG